ncbi:hypothetical protein FA95DRAFT_1680319 [Auriscalpium vulgare]|uniref:Uncharacterized protein n=1 Tax=Auriscalpium vulgare TaxID=40419 RepID=A0ACB8RPL3_9AGAM|nr:hypothetical protein FA95DRAFT_1680319 [Auriscalpium vulgare]
MSTSASSGLSRRLRGRLSDLPTMPLDILFEIFSYLPPSDLIYLARVTKPFRQVLLSRRQSALLWTQSYELVPDVPRCPEDMSEPAWAHFLFGGSYCYTCGTKPVNNIMFFLRRRACKKCMEKHMRTRYDLPFTFTDSESELLFCIRFFEGQVKPYGEDQFWWDSDVAILRDELDEILALHGGEQSDAYHQDLSEFAENLKVAYDAIWVHAELCEAWEAGRIEDRSLEISDIKNQRFNDIKERLMLVGHQEEDIYQLRDHKEVAVAKRMTDRIWRRVFPILQLELIYIIEDRLQLEADERRWQRRALIRPTFFNHLRVLPVRLAALLDSPTEESYEALNAVIGPDEAPTQEFCNRLSGVVSELLPSMLEDVVADAGRLIAAIPDDRRELAATVVSADTLCSDEFYTGTAGGLGLATTHYHNRLNRTLATGLDALAYRKRFGVDRDLSPTMAYSQSAAMVALGLLAKLGMEPASSAHAMDCAGARFQCGICPSLYGMAETENGWDRKAWGMCWRAAIEHALAEHRGREALHWVVLEWDQVHPPCADVAEVRNLEVGCAHCYHHLDVEGWCSLQEVLNHLAQSHGIGAPLENVDYFYNGTRWPRPVFEGMVTLRPQASDSATSE